MGIEKGLVNEVENAKSDMARSEALGCEKTVR
jgi:hypothetical protein